MFELSADGYLWTKALHIISVISWMAGLLYLPRLFVYHAGAEPGSRQWDTFVVMERRLLKAIMAPAMIAALLSGGLMAGDLGADIWSEGWWWIKVLCLAGLALSHALMIKWQGDFAAGRNARSGRFYRVVNEIPTLLMVVIVIFVVLKY